MLFGMERLPTTIERLAWIVAGDEKTNKYQSFQRATAFGCKRIDIRREISGKLDI